MPITGKRMPQELVNAIREAMARHRILARQFAEMASINPSTFHNALVGHNYISDHKLRLIHKALAKLMNSEPPENQALPPPVSLEQALDVLHQQYEWITLGPKRDPG